jgi:hypothetical protein
MEVWIVEWTQPGQNEVNITVWNTEQNARQQACADILHTLREWNIENGTDEKDLAESINTYVLAGDYKSAMADYNEFQSNSNDYENVDYFHVYPRIDLSAPEVPTLICFPVDEDDDIPDAEFEEIVPSIECPCGMFRADCEYHK